MIRGGALDGTKVYEYSSYDTLFEDEFNWDLFNFRDAFCMGNIGPNTNGNQFYLVQSPTVDPEHIGS
ncbi:MAG: peptidylprolyl isomerase [Chitinivibrionales bacterium]|nr:peptidylprolyl isomerase [Chitinivibrionales bacterium]